MFYEEGVVVASFAAEEQGVLSALSCPDRCSLIKADRQIDPYLTSIRDAVLRIDIDTPVNNYRIRCLEGMTQFLQEPD